MKKKIILMGMCLLMTTGCGTTIPKLSDGSEAMVTFKDDSKISADDLYELIKENHGLGYLVNLIDKHILEDEYKDKLEEATEYTDSHMSSLEASYGDDLEAAIQSNTGLGTIEAYRDSVYIGFLQNLAIEDYVTEFIKDSEIEDYYDDEIVGDIKVSHILITPEVTDDMDEDEIKDAEDDAKDEIEDIIKELEDAKDSELEAKFAELAEEYSQDASTKDSGGSLGFINKDTLGDAYDELVDAAYSLKDGKFSTKVITTEIGYHVVLRVESKDKPELEEVKEDILDALIAEYLRENVNAGVEALQDIRDEYGMDIIDSEMSTQYAAFIQGQLLSEDEVTE